jgi:hypothetical protein
MTEHKEVCPAHSGLCKAIKAEAEKNDIRFQMIEKSIELAKTELDRRLEGMNELREQLTLQASTFETVAEARLIHENILNRITNLEKSAWARQGEYRWSNHIVTVLIGLAVILGVWFITK